MAAAAIVFVSYATYFRDVWAGRTKPHAVSWLIWGVLTAIGFAGQVAGDAGPGAWATGLTAAVCLVVSGIGFAGGRTDIVRLDWVSLAGATIALALWAITRDPLLSVAIVTGIYALGYVPTFRKSYYRPHEETLATYALAGAANFVSLFALKEFSLLTALYPVAMLAMNWAFSAMLQVRRGQIAGPGGAERVYAAE